MTKYEIWDKEEYDYPLAFGFVPNMRDYLLEDGEIHPCMLIAPGGGYAFVSPSEGEVVAREFNALGYHCFVLTYTTNILTAVPLMSQPMKDMARAIRFLRKRAETFRLDPNRLYICGFSAAGHLCASICDYFEELSDSNPAYQDISCRPDGAILAYPVITSGAKAHQGSFQCLLGRDIYDRRDAESAALLERYSLEKHVGPNTPPCFLWQTMTDDLVPVENSYLYEAALREQGIPHAHHVFSHGHHGVSVANEAWASGDVGEPYALEQLMAIVDAAEAGQYEMSGEILAQLRGYIDPMSKNQDVVYPEVRIWPTLADAFFRAQ